MAADTFTSSGRIQLQGTGNNNLTWGEIADNQFKNLENMITGDNGYAGGAGGINVDGLPAYTLTANSGTSDQARQQLYPFVGALSSDCTVTIPGVVKIGKVLNATTGGKNIILTTSGSGATLTVAPTSSWMDFYCDGSNVISPPVTLQGVTNGTDSQAGTVGEYLTTGPGGAGSLTSGVAKTVASMSLTPGAWDAWGSVFLGATAQPTGGSLSISMTSGAHAAWPDGGFILLQYQGLIAAQQDALWTGHAHYNLTVSTPIYLVTTMNFTGNMTAQAYMAARRRR